MNLILLSVHGRSSSNFYVMQLVLFSLFLLSVTLRQCLSEEIWRETYGKDIEIGASTEGYDRIRLRCGTDRMTVKLRMTESFSGVIYTQGSFHSRNPSCFIDPIRGRSFTMNIPLDECDTKKDGDKYSNTLVIQHDDDLVTPGDAAFILECDFSETQDFTVTADFNGEVKRKTRSSISLVDADPGRDRTKRAAHVESDTEEVVFVPNETRKAKDEL